MFLTEMSKNQNSLSSNYQIRKEKTSWITKCIKCYIIITIAITVKLDNKHLFRHDRHVLAYRYHIDLLS